jgi:hypothetical protein
VTPRRSIAFPAPAPGARSPLAGRTFMITED